MAIESGNEGQFCRPIFNSVYMNADGRQKAHTKARKRRGDGYGTTGGRSYSGEDICEKGNNTGTATRTTTTTSSGTTFCTSPTGRTTNTTTAAVPATNTTTTTTTATTTNATTTATTPTTT
eukprot:1260875-Pyramimonas_sp.AAC.1